MTEQEKVWFAEIEKDREEDAKVFNKPAHRGYMQGIIAKYSGLGHFVYELLQNADDAHATEASFDLYDDRLIFRHNGSVHFSVTSLASEHDDQSKIGHLNAITGSGGFSTKILQNETGNAIGKFGVGFKAVFQYTLTPEVYDDNMRFRLENYIVPRLIECDYPGRKSGETLFVFPFDKFDGTKSSSEIWKALTSLVYPTLFLNQLKHVTFSFNGQDGAVREEGEYYVYPLRQDPTGVIRLVETSKRTGVNRESDRFWLFTERSERGQHKYSVGYLVGDDGLIKPIDRPAFCFFPTRHNTKLRFIIHAPFKLTDNREGILAGSDHNELMIRNLAGLATRGLAYLCRLSEKAGRRIVSDDIVKIIPIGKEDYGDGISFGSFREAFVKLFAQDRVIPTKSACYIDRPHAYWPESIAVPSLFSDEQLQSLYGVQGIRWAFPTIPRENKSRNVGKELTADVFDFIERCTAECVYDNNLIGRITAEFIEHQPMEWMEKFYDWIADNKDRVRKAQTAPIFFNQHGKACAISAENGTVQLYLPLEGEDRYDMVRADLLDNEHAKKLLDKYNLKTPDRRDWIETILSQKLLNATVTEKDGLLKQVLDYYVTSCGEDEKEKIAGHLMTIPCWKSTADGDSSYLAERLYVESESETLHAYFGCVGGAKYVDAKRYLSMVEDRYAKDVQMLFCRVGMAKLPRFERNLLSSTEAFALSMDKRYEFPRSTQPAQYFESRIDGLDEFLKAILNEGDAISVKRRSLLLWKMIGDVAAEKAKELGSADVSNCFRQFMLGIYKYFFRMPQKKGFVSRQYERLLESAWLVSADGSMIAPKDAAGDSLDGDYSKLPDFSVICSMLKIPETSDLACETVDEQHARAALSDAAKDALALGEQASKLGITAKDIEELAKKKAGQPEQPLPIDPPMPPKGDGEGTLERVTEKVKKAVEKTRTFKEEKQGRRGDSPTRERPMLPAVDSDPMQPMAVDFEKRAEELRKKVEAEIDQLEVDAKLQQTAVDADEYSYAWLMSRLELEMRANGVEEGENREASVSFAKMEREEGTENMFMLSATSNEIPQWFEEEVNQRLTIRIPGRQDIETVIESMSVLSFRLRAKVRILPGMENIDYSMVTEAKTVATKPSFLLDELRKGYESLDLADDYNLKANLPEQMRFIFGPPGTGKTTHLARKELIPLAKSDEHPHVLVLTPTNKAADVLTKRIIQECGEDESYKQWLTRFGITLDPALMGSPVARAKDVEIDDDHSAVVITTVIRFAYDAFTSMKKEMLSDFKWDYIVVDEASMIPLMQILYPIYKAKGAKFVIAGDPMQIAPVIMSDLSKGQNIYAMVGLEDFANPKTEPYDYKVVCLDEQYRSVPCIGRIFSEFAYSGKLRHHRSAAEEMDLGIAIDGMPTIKPLTLLRYPVSRFESIFKIKLLGKSSYQIYSALFIFEYICKLAEGLKKAGCVGFRIGVISPYRAQSDIVGRLVAKVSRSFLEGVEVTVGTVHSFQGDECEMIIALLNPPQGMGRREGSFINDKKVLNVAISRARDYLVVAIPDAKTPNVQYLRGPLTIASLMRQTPGVFAELQTPDLEYSVWGDGDYVEKNTYSTGHQNVNVYETPEKRFEVRSEELSLDVHFRADRSDVAPNDEFVSERERIEIEINAEDQARQDFVVPEGFHKPTEGERVPAMKQYYVIGKSEPLECESEAEDIDPSLVLAIED